MIIYVDENISPYLSRGFNILQTPENVKISEPIEVRSIKDEFGTGAKDEDWIPIAGERNSCVLTQDYNISRIAHQKALCEKYGLGMFYFRPPSKNGFLYWDMLKLMVKHWPSITRISIRESRPFAFKVTSRGDLEKM